MSLKLARGGIDWQPRSMEGAVELLRDQEEWLYSL